MHDFTLIPVHFHPPKKGRGLLDHQFFCFNSKLREWHLFNDGTLKEEWIHKNEIAGGYIVFTVTRNPWKRFISGWQYLDAYKNKSLIEVLNDLPAEGHDYRHLTRPQLNILVDAEGVFVPDFVLRFESLAEDYSKFCDVIGKKDKTLPRMNSTIRNTYIEYFDPVTIKMVERHFKKDIEFLGYEFPYNTVKHIHLKDRFLS